MANPYRPEKKPILTGLVSAFVLGIVLTLATIFAFAAFQPDGRITFYVTRHK